MAEAKDRTLSELTPPAHRERTLATLVEVGGNLMAGGKNVESGAWQGASRRTGAKRYDGLKRRLRPSCLSISFSSFRSTSRIVRSRESGVVGAGPGILANCAAIISLRFVTVRVRLLGTRPSGHKRRMAAKTVRWLGAVSVSVGGGIGCSVAVTVAARGSAYTAPDVGNAPAQGGKRRRGINLGGRAGPTGSMGTTRPRRRGCGEMHASTCFAN